MYLVQKYAFWDTPFNSVKKVVLKILGQRGGEFVEFVNNGKTLRNSNYR